jgi:hypothetical protein
VKSIFLGRVIRALEAGGDELKKYLVAGNLERVRTIKRGLKITTFAIL